MQIAVITDIHFGPAGFHKGIQRKLTEQAAGLTEAFVTKMNTNVQPSLVLNLGDLIQDADEPTDLDNINRGMVLLNGLSMPHYHAIGNHDQMHLPVSELPTLFGQDNPYYSFDQDGWHFIGLHSSLMDKEIISAEIDAAQFAWLQADLAATDLPTLVFTHYSLADQELSENYYFVDAPQSCLLQNRVEVRQILADSGKVKLVLNGHLHWNRLDVHDDIPYITIQSLTENFNADDVPAATWALVSLSEESITVDIHGNDPAFYRL